MARSPASSRTAAQRHRPRLTRTSLAVCLLIAVVASDAREPERARAQNAPDRPNILFVMTDDQRFDSISVMPRTQERFNIEFRRAFATDPLCCPSRTTILTGEYAHRTGVTSNSKTRAFRERQRRSLGPWLRKQGYRTGFIGKYMNGFNPGHSIPPGWDEFHALMKRRPGHPRETRNWYTSFWLRQYRRDGPDAGERWNWYSAEEDPDLYSTTLFGGLAEDFIRGSQDPDRNPQGKPWALFLWPNAPHTPLTPETAYEDADVPEWDRPPSFMQRGGRQKPWEIRGSRWRNSDPDFHLNTRDQQLRMLMSVDDQVERLFGVLEELDVLDHTWGVYTSDQGYSWGEFRLTGKVYAYEHLARMPLRMSVPGQDPTSTGAFVANIDLAPTLMRLAGDRSRHRFQGRNLGPLVRGEVARVRPPKILLEAWWPHRYRGIRTSRWKYVYWRDSGRRELYDLRQDPFEVRNLASARRDLARKLHLRMRRLFRSEQ